MTMDTRSFPTFGLTHYVHGFKEPHNCVDPQRQVVWNILFCFLLSLNKHRYYIWIPFGCRETCNDVLIVDSLPSSSIVSPQRPPHGTSQSSLVQVVLQLCSTTICSHIDSMYITRETNKLHSILWCSKSCDCNKDKYDMMKCLVAR
jgi:hypothetical protein